MKKSFRFFVFVIIILNFVLSCQAQKQGLYPQNTEKLIELINHLLKVNFSKTETIEKLGTIEKNKENLDETEDQSYDEIEDESIIYLKPFSANGKNIEELYLTTGDDPKIIEELEFSFTKPAQISFGTMKKTYGKFHLIPPPIINCGRNPDCNRNPFTGYFFRFPAKISGKTKNLRIMLMMNQTETFPKHTANSILEVERIRISREIDFEDIE